MKIRKLGYQTTIDKEISFIGFSPYEQGDFEMKFLPAPKDTGIIFVYGETKIPVNPDHVEMNTNQNTTNLVKDDICIRTVEHLLSAIWGLGIDNLEIHLDKNIVPFLDASSNPYVNYLKDNIIKIADSERKFICIEDDIEFEHFDKDLNRTIKISPSNELRVRAKISFPNIIGDQEYSHVWTPESYEKDISIARSFVGSTLDEDGEKWKRIKKLFGNFPDNPYFSPIIAYSKDKYITPLRVENEPVRHKILDLYGDICLLGVRIIGDIQTDKPSHAMTREFVQHLYKLMKKHELVST